MDNKKEKDDALKVDGVLEKKEPLIQPHTVAYPSDWTFNTVKGIWDNKYNNTIIIMGKL